MAKHQVTYAANLDELVRRMRRFEGKTVVLLQRYLQGRGHGVSVLMLKATPLMLIECNGPPKPLLSALSSVLTTRSAPS